MSQDGDVNPVVDEEQTQQHVDPNEGTAPAANEEEVAKAAEFEAEQNKKTNEEEAARLAAEGEEEAGRKAAEQKQKEEEEEAARLAAEEEEEAGRKAAADAALAGKIADDEAEQKKTEEEEEAARQEAAAAEEAERKAAEEEAAAAQQAEEERAARESLEAEEGVARKATDREETKASKRMFNVMVAEAKAIAVRKADEEDLQQKIDARRAELERLRGIIAQSEAERIRVSESQEQVRDEEGQLDAAVMKRDELDAKKSSLTAAIEQVGNAEEIGASLDQQEATIISESLQHVWEESVKEDDLSKADVTTLNLRNLKSRLEQCAAQQEHWVYRANELLLKSEQEKNLASIEVDSAIADINKSFESEKKQLTSTRKQLKALETEQAYHIRRGTYIKDPQANAPKDKDFDGDKELDMHNQTCAEIVDERERLSNLIDDVRGLRKDVDGAQKVAGEQVSVLQVQIDEAKATAEEMEWEKELLMLEQEDLAAVKKELIAVTAAVKHQRK